MQYFIKESIHTKFILGMHTQKENTKKSQNVFITTGLTVGGGAVIREAHQTGRPLGCWQSLISASKYPFLGFSL